MKEYKGNLIFTKKKKLFIFEDLVDYEQNIQNIDDVLVFGDVDYVIGLLTDGVNAEDELEKIRSILLS